MESTPDGTAPDPVVPMQSAEPQWFVRRTPLTGWRRLSDRMLAQAEVTMPDGRRYVVRVGRNRPLRGTAFDALGERPPEEITLSALVAANAHPRRRTGWTVAVVGKHPVWSGERVVIQQAARTTDVADIATTWWHGLRRGEPPWDDGRMVRAAFRRSLDDG